MTSITFGSVVACFLLGYLVYAYIRNEIRHRSETAFGNQRGCQPVTAKVPYSWPLGLDIVHGGFKAHWDGRLLAFMEGIYDGLGPNIEQTLLGVTGFVTMDPENIETILSTRFEDYGFGPRSLAFSRLLGRGIFTQEGREWENSRALLRRQFVRMQYQNLEKFGEHANNLVRAIRTAGMTIDLQPLFFRYTLDTTTALIFGHSVSSLVQEGRDSFSEAFGEAANITAFRARLGDLYWAYTPARFAKACDAIKGYVDDYVKDALGQNDTSDKFAFVQQLFEELKDPVLVRDQLVNVLLAGRDTTACLMTWTFYMLIRHPAVLKKVQIETQHVLGEEHDITRTHVRKMRYLDCVLKETLRIYPPVPANLRFATKTTVLPRGGGPDGCSPILIRKGMGMTYIPYLMHRRKELYGDDAAVFRPERWQEARLAKIGWGFLPFNDGPRVCLGKDLALMEATYGIVRIVQSFPKIRLSLDQKREESGNERHSLTLVLASADGCKVAID